MPIIILLRMCNVHVWYVLFHYTSLFGIDGGTTSSHFKFPFIEYKVRIKLLILSFNVISI